MDLVAGLGSLDKFTSYLSFEFEIHAASLGQFDIRKVFDFDTLWLEKCKFFKKFHLNS